MQACFALQPIERDLEPLRNVMDAMDSGSVGGDLQRLQEAEQARGELFLDTGSMKKISPSRPAALYAHPPLTATAAHRCRRSPLPLAPPSARRSCCPL